MKLKEFYERDLITDLNGCCYDSDLNIYSDNNGKDYLELTSKNIKKVFDKQTEHVKDFLKELIK